jgi:hypothetical protein
MSDFFGMAFVGSLVMAATGGVVWLLYLAFGIAGPVAVITGIAIVWVAYLIGDLFLEIIHGIGRDR